MTAAALDLTPAERRFKAWMGVSALLYAGGGATFALAGDRMLRLLGGPPRTEDFWVTLAVSMSATIAACCYLVWRDVRGNRAVTIPLMVAKTASSVGALAFFALDVGRRSPALLSIPGNDVFLLAVTCVLWRAARRG